MAVHGSSIGRKKEEEKKKGVIAVYGGSVGRGQFNVNLLHFMNIIVNIFFSVTELFCLLDHNKKRNKSRKEELRSLFYSAAFKISAKLKF